MYGVEIKRADVQEDVEQYLAFEKAMLAEVKEIVNELSF